VARVVSRFDPSELPALRRPRDQPIPERAAGEDTFEASGGPVTSYRRTVVVEDGTAVQTVQFRLAIPYFAWFFLPLFRHDLRLPSRDRPQWWHPPDRWDARQSSVLGILCFAAVLFGYLNTLFNQTLAFAADDFHATNGDQGVAGALVRLGGLIAFVILAAADRRGRRRMILVATGAGCVFAASGAAAPSLAWLTGSQILTQGCAYGLYILLPIVAAEELPAGSRAYAIGLVAMAASLGAGVAVVALRFADVAPWGWRIDYLIALAGLPLLPGLARRLPESRRFATPHAEVAVRGHGRRLWLLAAAGFLINLFVAPDALFGNRFLRHERHFSGGAIAAFTIATSTPAVIGIIVGGRLADRRARKPVAIASLTFGTTLAVLFYFASNLSLWASALASNIVYAAAIPALGVYGPELFPTSLRGRANGLVFMMGLAGSSAGLLATGRLADHFGRIGPGIAVMGVGPLLLALLVWVAFPETARRELEDLNPEDEPPPLPP
jgi:MFS family permease